MGKWVRETRLRGKRCFQRPIFCGKDAGPTHTGGAVYASAGKIYTLIDSLPLSVVSVSAT